MLYVVLHPSLAPSVLCECIHTAPSRDYNGVKEFLTSSSPLQPQLPNKQEYRKDNAVSNECRSHDEVRQTLPHMVSSAETQCSNPPKQHLYPAEHWH